MVDTNYKKTVRSSFSGHDPTRQLETLQRNLASGIQQRLITIEEIRTLSGELYRLGGGEALQSTLNKLYGSNGLSRSSYGEKIFYAMKSVVPQRDNITLESLAETRAFYLSHQRSGQAPSGPGHSHLRSAVTLIFSFLGLLIIIFGLKLAAHVSGSVVQDSASGTVLPSLAIFLSLLFIFVVLLVLWKFQPTRNVKEGKTQLRSSRKK